MDHDHDEKMIQDVGDLIAEAMVVTVVVFLLSSGSGSDVLSSWHWQWQ